MAVMVDFDTPLDQICLRIAYFKVQEETIPFLSWSVFSKNPTLVKKHY